MVIKWNDFEGYFWIQAGRRAEEKGQRGRLALWAARLPLPLTDAAQASLAPARAPAPSHCWHPTAPHCSLACCRPGARTLFLWYPQLVPCTSLGSLPKCPFPREDFPVKKKRSSLPSVKNSARIASKHSLCLAFTAHHSRYVLACKFSICLSHLDGGVSESWELFHSLLNPQNVDQHPAHSSCAINFC